MDKRGSVKRRRTVDITRGACDCGACDVTGTAHHVDRTAQNQFRLKGAKRPNSQIRQVADRS